MLTVKDHNDQAVAAYAAVAGQYWIEALKDGRHVLIRPLTEKDRLREYDFIKRLSPESRHMRFLAQISEPGTALLDQLMDTDNQQRTAFIAVILGAISFQDCRVCCGLMANTLHGARCSNCSAVVPSNLLKPWCCTVPMTMTST